MDWTVAPGLYPRIVPIRSPLFARRVRIANRGIRIQLTRSTTRPAPATGRTCWSSRYHDEHGGHQGRYRQNDEHATQHTASFPFTCITTLTDDPNKAALAGLEETGFLRQQVGAKAAQVTGQRRGGVRGLIDTMAGRPLGASTESPLPR